ncbi:biotin transporter BioY [Halanaeroarchaeum sulfurireducens]|uniref:Biotin synthesis protein n=1 Tax=Halanaeroarchaeum sulfurireducens TaxID=1604004 RepID=A0A0F7P8Q3_9EURY|nr:biotin transporter BioY [Halanaeroarchaeum sulfurireducens]AKH96605.1 biotin synthesis protein [Halanaeroarchaeum sulfurireducens]ALG81007.1 biotin synthesis protein [Halanaeroarchaeum sulfurireducens]
MSVETDTVDLVGDDMVENVARAAVFAALTGAFAYVSFPHPLTTVPITLQVLGVFLAGIFLGPVWGFASMGVYVAAGAVGAPIFAFGAAGVGVLLGKLGGFLWSYPIAAAVVGVIVHGTDGPIDPADVSLARLVGGMALATVVIYAFGTVGFAIAGDVGPGEAFVLSSAPFVPVELVKMAAAVGIVRSEAVAAT